MVLWAKDSPTAPDPPLPPERLAATAAARASAVMVELSDAVTRSALPALTDVPVVEASMRVPIRLSVHSPPMDTAIAVSVEAAMATDVAATTALMTAVLAADTTTSSPAPKCELTTRAFTSMGATPPYSSQPMRLRAREKPIATPGVVPETPAATATAIAATRASMSEEFVAVMASPPAAMSEVDVTVAWVCPLIRLTAVAPPPANATLPLSETATLTAEAVEVAAMLLDSEAATNTSPPAVATGTAVRVASVSVWMSLRAMLMATPTLADSLRLMATEMLGASTLAWMDTASSAVTVRSPPARTAGEVRMAAWTLVDNRLRATTTPTAIESEFSVRLLAKATAEAETTALIAAADVAVTAMSPPASRVERATVAMVRAGFLTSVAMTSPTMASRMLNRMFCESMPTVLTAMVTPTEVPAEEVVVSVVASRMLVFAAATVTVSSLLVPAAMALSRAEAMALLRTRLLATTKLTAVELPSLM